MSPAYRDWKADKVRFGPLPWLLQPGFWAVTVYRFGRHTLTCNPAVRPLLHGVYFALYFIVRLITGIDIPRTVFIGPGLMIHHYGTLIVHPQARLGSYCTLRHGVTIGERHVGGGVPVIGDRVEFGSYSHVLGGVRIGDDVKIGALSLVLSDTPPSVSVVGIPAKISIPDSSVSSEKRCQ